MMKKKRDRERGRKKERAGRNKRRMEQTKGKARKKGMKMEIIHRKRRKEEKFENRKWRLCREGGGDRGGSWKRKKQEVKVKQ